VIAALDEGANFSSLRIAVSAGETLPASVFEARVQRTGRPIVDGIGAIEMLHIFISNRLDDLGPGRTGRQEAGYDTRIVDDRRNDLPRGEIGKPWSARSKRVAGTERRAAE
jgi:2-aminobenzoate-CoA ligase